MTVTITKILFCYNHEQIYRYTERLTCVITHIVYWSIAIVVEMTIIYLIYPLCISVMSLGKM